MHTLQEISMDEISAEEKIAHPRDAQYCNAHQWLYKLGICFTAPEPYTTLTLCYSYQCALRHYAILTEGQSGMPSFKSLVEFYLVFLSNFTIVSTNKYLVPLSPEVCCLYGTLRYKTPPRHSKTPTHQMLPLC